MFVKLFPWMVLLKVFHINGTEGILGDTLSKFSIWGLYITFVLAVGRFIRLQCSDLRMRIPYENLPSCDRYWSSFPRWLYTKKIKFLIPVESINLVGHDLTDFYSTRGFLALSLMEIG